MSRDVRRCQCCPPRNAPSRSEPTVTLATDLGYVTEQAAAPAAQSATIIGAGLDGPGVFTTYLCGTCHNIDSAGALVGPSLYDIGSRMSTAEIYEAIMEPDATIAEGFSAGIMPATLNATGFFQKVSSEELRALVNYLADQEGD